MDGERVLHVVEEVRIAPGADPGLKPLPSSPRGRILASVNSRRCSRSRTYRFAIAS